MASQKPFDTPPASIRSSESSSSSSNHAVKNVVDAVKLVSAAQSASTTTTLPTDSPSKLPHSLSFSLNRKSKKSTKSHKTSAGPPVPFPAPAAPIHSYIPSKSSSTVTDDTATPSSNPDDETRPRYHSAISRSTISRSQSSSFAGKLQSLRKKIESELSRKRPGSNTNQQSNGGKRTSKRAQKGTVAGLRPSPALTVPEGMSVADASQLCAAKRADCVLVVDEEEGLSGIFTAKDLAFRVTAEGLDPRSTSVAQIMTKNPMVTRDTTNATEALQLMVSRGFRHLPVCNEDGDVVGLLDITKVFHEALAKVERGSTATNQLSAALAGVQSELGPGLNHNPQAAAMLAYVETLRERMALPDLTTVIDTRSAPPTVTPRTTVREAARLMKERRTTAVCVMEANAGTSAVSGVSGGNAIPKIAGIFTSKDIVLRVIAAGLDASRCSVVRVMTPHPDTAPPTMVVQDALKKMHNGHYLNLPVVEADGRLIGIVDVLKLTYATLEQIESMNEDRSNESGPMWSRFFESLPGAGGDDDTASVVSASERPDTPNRSHLGHGRGLSSMTSPISEIMPNDSASVHGPASSVAAPALPVDDGTYIFKFRTPSGRTHRFQARHDSYELLRDIVAGKLLTDPFFTAPGAKEGEAVHLPDPSNFTLHYTDDEGDLVTMTADSDVADAVRIARGQKSDRIVLLVDGGKVWEEAARDLGGEKAVEKLKEVEQEVKAVEEEEKQMAQPTADPAVEPTYGNEHVHAQQWKDHGRTIRADGQELVGGIIPKDMVLPAAIGFLGVVILGVFIAGRK
ncbi:CBS and PB1 domain-containing protein [Cryptococcus deuterogattii LA55]|nr:CBS and PB1 domain-containing protein [Cryptococcus deuterogattii LA55]KIR95900.1 CBS and PB1 domain-containing protein [Cryptococcus deuterogattii CBS 10090]